MSLMIEREKDLMRHWGPWAIHIDGQGHSCKHSIGKQKSLQRARTQKSPHGAKEAFGPCNGGTGGGLRKGAFGPSASSPPRVRNTCGGPLLDWGILIFPNGFLFFPGSS